MNITIENESSLKGLSGPVGDYHTTLLDEYKFTRKTARFQNITYWDVWDAGEDPVSGNDLNGYRIVDGQGVTLEGHGEGIRVLVNGSVRGRQLIEHLAILVDRLKGVEEQRVHGEFATEDDIVF